MARSGESGRGRGGAARRKATRDAVAQASKVTEAREAARSVARPQSGKTPRGASDPFSSELRRRDVLPLLVLHYVSDGPSYGNQLMERISAVTGGVLSVNPNTMYPLLRSLESRGLIEGSWEHPERRSRRYYAITDAGREEYATLEREVRPFLESIQRSIEEIVHEVYGGEA
jgi:DNA-binding PadR family transcriptional regulator